MLARDELVQSADIRRNLTGRRAEFHQVFTDCQEIPFGGPIEVLEIRDDLVDGCPPSAFRRPALGAAPENSQAPPERFHRHPDGRSNLVGTERYDAIHGCPNRSISAKSPKSPTRRGAGTPACGVPTSSGRLLGFLPPEPPPKGSPPLLSTLARRLEICGRICETMCRFSPGPTEEPEFADKYWEDETVVGQHPPAATLLSCPREAKRNYSEESTLVRNG